MFPDPENVVREAVEDIWVRRSSDAFERWHAPDFKNRTAPPGSDVSAASFKQSQMQFLNAFSDTHVDFLQQVVEGNRVASHFRVRGAHTGVFMGVAPSGTSVEVAGMRIDRVAAGRIAEHWAVLDLLGLMRQITPAA